MSFVHVLEYEYFVFVRVGDLICVVVAVDNQKDVVGLKDVGGFYEFYRAAVE